MALKMATMCRGVKWTETGHAYCCARDSCFGSYNIGTCSRFIIDEGRPVPQSKRPKLKLVDYADLRN